jgi:two-component system phosphate regulon sensor histidine kinase PhoR
MLAWLAVIFISAALAWALTVWTQDLGTILLVTFVAAFVLSLLAVHLISCRMTQPLHEMTEVARKLALGQFDRQTEIRTEDEVADLGRALNVMAAALHARVADISEDRARLQAVLSSMVEGVLVLDRHGRILLMNEAMRRMFPLADSVVIGRSFIEVFRHHRLSELVKTVLESGQGCLEEVVLLMPEEHTFSIQASVAKQGSEPDVAAVFVFHDITELKRLERVRKDFVANVSHELKTPLTSIKGYVEALIDGAKDDPDKCAQFLGIIQKHSEGLNAILSDLLQLSTIESGVYPWKQAAIVIPEVIERAARLLRSTAERKRHTLVVGSCDGLPAIYGDPDRLTEALINLMDNAVKYTPDGGRVSIDARSTGHGVEISVTDTGIGIPPRELQRIFERFYRVDRARSRELGGTGLGLSIVKHIVEAHGGTVSVESAIGKGSRFTISLPMRPAAA